MNARATPLAGGFLLLLASCGSSGPAARDNLAYLYGRSTGELRLQARVYHNGPDRSTIYFQLRTIDLLYKGAGEGSPFKAAVMVSYASLPSWDSRTVLDSASTMVRDQADAPGIDKDLIGTMAMRRDPKRGFVLRLTAHDLNRDVSTSVMIQVDPDHSGDRFGFLPMDTATDLPLFDDHLPEPMTVQVRCERYAGRVLQGSWHKAVSALPAPVFSTQGRDLTPGQPDSVFTVSVDKDGHFLFTADRRGLYHFRPDTASKDGYTLFLLGESYPDVRSARAMLPPLRYITSMQEFDAMRTATDQRKAIERFWLDAAGERTRARSAIRAYYGRVENANRHFTSTVEGWRTDRGLVHVIFGTPNVIHRSERGETWIYGEETNLMSLNFNFVKRTNAYTDNDMVLERDPQLKGAWYRNVESWRNGRVYQN